MQRGRDAHLVLEDGHDRDEEVTMLLEELAAQL
jgi:hypothetical protein